MIPESAVHILFGGGGVGGGGPLLILGKNRRGKKSWQCKLKNRCNYFARHWHSLVNIYSSRNQQHLHNLLGHDWNKTLIDTRQYL